MKFRVEWWKRKKKGCSRQSVVLFNDDDVVAPTKLIARVVASLPLRRVREGALRERGGGGSHSSRQYSPALQWPLLSSNLVILKARTSYFPVKMARIL